MVIAEILEIVKDRVVLDYNQEELIQEFITVYVQNIWDDTMEDKHDIANIMVALCRCENFKYI